MIKTLAVILAAILVVASTAGTFYIARAQDQQPQLSQVAQGRDSAAAKITVSNDKVQAGSAVNVTGRNFDTNSQISIYFMSARQADFAKNGRSALILQEAAAMNEKDVQSNVDLTTMLSSFSTPTIIPIAAVNDDNNNNNSNSSSSNDILGNALKTLGGIFHLGGNSNDNSTKTKDNE